MSIHTHHLTGCAPTPLAYYLKALGVLRLVTEQKDPDARGWWQDEAFHLLTCLDREALERFFLEEYAPTPAISPWNKGSGFVFAANNPALAVLERTADPRFLAFREAIYQSRRLVSALAEADAAVRRAKDKTKGKSLSRAERLALRDDPTYKAELAEADRQFKRLKNGLIPRCRREWRGPHQAWLDAALVLNAEGEPKCPAILGSGGNDGKNDFTKQSMECLCSVLPLDPCARPVAASREWLRCALQGRPEGPALSALPVGQFHPGGAGGANMTTGADASAVANPWDYILLIEGTIVFVSSVARRAATRTPTQAAAPFAIHPASCGYASASRSEKDTRGEQWMPVWNSPATLGEIRRVFGEGRAQLGRTGASRPVDFARSVARLGVARGITAFQRFGYLERNGQANLAVPLGRWRVTPQPHQDLLDDLDRTSWMDRLQRAARDERAASSLAVAHHTVDEAVMAVCAHGTEPVRWQALLLALVDIEEQLVRSGKFTAKQGLQPIPPLSAGWVAAADDGSPEFRLAVALALQAADESGHEPIRRHWLPLLPGTHRFATDAGGLRKDPRVVCSGMDAERDLIALVSRRLVDGAKGAASRLQLVAAPGFHSRPADLALLLAGSVDLTRVCNLARAFMALDRRGLGGAASALSPPQVHVEPPPLYGLFRLACLPWPLCLGAAEVHVRCDPAVFARLGAGDLVAGGDIAIRRLKAVGLVPVLRHVVGGSVLARRLAISLAFPICQRDAARLAARLTKPQPQE